MIDGFLLINKPPHITSHSVVSKIRKIFNTKFINIKTSNDIIGTEYAAILKNIYAILGARPQFIKYAPVSSELSKINNIKPKIKKIDAIEYDQQQYDVLLLASELDPYYYELHIKPLNNKRPFSSNITIKASSLNGAEIIERLYLFNSQSIDKNL